MYSHIYTPTYTYMSKYTANIHTYTVHPSGSCPPATRPTTADGGDLRRRRRRQPVPARTTTTAQPPSLPSHPLGAAGQPENHPPATRPAGLRPWPASTSHPRPTPPTTLPPPPLPPYMAEKPKTTKFIFNAKSHKSHKSTTTNGRSEQGE
ncbi:hypothetical protein Dimus_039013 [Dionaea muscipula]